MPTGYTSDIYDGKDVSFEDSTWTCARAFNHLASMRDLPMGTPIPEKFEAPKYHAEELVKAQARLAEVESWDYDRATAEASNDYEKRLQRWEEADLKSRGRHERYEAILAQAQAWIPPTSDHNGLKELMVEQLKKSIELDCRSYETLPPLEGDVYREEQVAEAERGIVYHTEQHAEEVQRANKRTQWVQTLRDSFKQAALEVGDGN